MKSQTHYKALLTMDYHRIEKGLSLKEPRLGFGASTITDLMANLKKYINQFCVDDTALNSYHALQTYHTFLI